MSENTLVNESATDANTLEVENQAIEAKSYSQEEVDNMMARMKGSLQKKLLKPYEELGDVDELRNMKSQAEQLKQEEALKRGEFETVLKELASKKDAEIQKRDSVIKEYKVNTPLLSSAANNRAVNPEQVKALLASNVRLNEDGEVEVIDTKGAIRYTDNGSVLGVDDLVREFLDSNPHFVQPTAATANTKSSHGSDLGNGFDVSKLDMSNPAHRKLYAEARAKGKL
jgi:hypothetical protein|tara:strand:+ start:4282 stop:4962 length:681 start_codon:yes stop_codon:yes gene_type:complete